MIQEYSGHVILFRKLLRDKGFTDSEIDDIFETYDELCPYCLDDLKGCQCWNDE